ncbi:hypothetical protein [Pararhodobacter sp.]
MEAVSFDRATARVFNHRPGGSRHIAYQDGAGSICLWVRSDLERDGCAISASAIEWLDGMPGAHFIRLANARGRLDVVMPMDQVPMDQVPMGEAREGRHGRHFIVDPDDLTGPPFAPLRDFGEGGGHSDAGSPARIARAGQPSPPGGAGGGSGQCRTGPASRITSAEAARKMP